MDEIARRFATQASVPARARLHRAARCIEAGLQRIGGRAILNSANLEDGERPGSRLDRVFTLAREYGAAVICLLIDEEGQARDVEWKLRGRPPHPRPRRRALRPRARRPDLRPAHVPAVHRRRRPAPRRHGDDRGDPAHQGRAPRRLHRCSACRTCRFGLKPAGPPRAQLACSCTSACRPASTPPSCTPRKIMPLEPHPRRAARGLPRPHLRPARRRRLRPAAEAARGVRRRQARRRSRRRTAPAGRSRSGSSSASSTATATASTADLDEAPGRRASTPLDDRQRRPARRHEGRRRAVRLRPDAAAVRAAVGRDDEDRGRLPRAAHGEGRAATSARAASCSPP